jgi:hypothetical protein
LVELSVLDQGCLCRIPDLNFSSRIQVKKDPVPDPYQRILVFLTQKLFLSSRKNDLGCSLRIPDPEFFSIPDPDPGFKGKKAPDPGSGSVD